MVDEALAKQASKIIDRMGGKEGIRAEYDTLSKSLIESSLESNVTAVGDSLAVAGQAYIRLADLGAFEMVVETRDGGTYLAGLWGGLICDLGLLWSNGMDEMKRGGYSTATSYVLIEMVSAAIYFDLEAELLSIVDWIEVLNASGIIMTIPQNERQLSWQLCISMAEAVRNGERLNFASIPAPYRSALEGYLLGSGWPDLKEIIDWRNAEAVKGMRYDKPPFHSVSYSLVPIEILALLKLAGHSAYPPAMDSLRDVVLTRTVAERIGGESLARLRAVFRACGAFVPVR